jgi:hypothetical protein
LRDGRILVRSTPAGAIARLNGVDQGRTPLAIRQLDYGRYRVTVVLPGHDVAEREVLVTRGAPAAALTVELVRATPGANVPLASGSPAAPSAQRGAAVTMPAAESSLEIVSRPSGVRVVVDGQPIGTTPLRISGLAPGTHSIQLEQAGYRPWTDKVTTTSGRLTRVSASLEPGTPR